MGTYNYYFAFLGYLLVFLCGSSAVILSAISKIDSKQAWNIIGISILAGLFLVSGERITEIVTPLATIKTKENEANSIVDKMNRLKSSMEETNRNAKSQAENIERINQHYESVIKEIEHDAPILIKIMLTETRLESKKNQILYITDVNTRKEFKEIIDTLKDEIQKDRKKLIRLKDN